MRVLAILVEIPPCKTHTRRMICSEQWLCTGTSRERWSSYGSSDGSHAGKRIPSNSIQHILLHFGNSSHSCGLTLLCTSYLSIFTQVGMKMYKLPAFWCTSLWAPFGIQSFCCSNISVYQSINQMHIRQCGIRKMLHAPLLAMTTQMTAEMQVCFQQRFELKSGNIFD